jgi:hypothetical protein
MKRPLIAALLITSSLATAGCAYDLTEVEPYREVACFEAAKVSLRDAVEAAEIEGGRAIDAAYRQVREMGCLERDAGYYDVTVLIDDKLSLVSVDAASEQIVPRKQQGLGRDIGGQFFERLFEGSPEKHARAAARMQVHLHQAIDTAEKAGGKAMEARADEKGGRAGYTLKLVDRGKLRLTWVDGVSL